MSHVLLPVHSRSADHHQLIDVFMRDALYPPTRQHYRG